MSIVSCLWRSSQQEFGIYVLSALCSLYDVPSYPLKAALLNAYNAYNPKGDFS